MMGFNISPETLVAPENIPDELLHLRNVKFEDLLHRRVDLALLKKYNLIMSPTGQFYRRDIKGFFGTKLEKIYAKRKVVKRGGLVNEQNAENARAEINHRQEYGYMTPQDSMFNGWSIDQIEEYTLDQDDRANKANILQNVQKIFMNSVYGAFSNRHFRYCLFENAESITAFGRMVNRWNINAINKFLNEIVGTEDTDYVITADTDSNYYHLKAVADMIVPEGAGDHERADVMDRFHKEVLGPEIDQNTEEMVQYFNALENKMVWEREAIAKTAIWVAKKNYTMLVLDSEGVRYDTPHHKTVGLETVKSATAKWAKNHLEKLYVIAMEEGESAVQDHIAKVYGDMVQLNVEELANSQAANGFSKYHDPVTLFRKGTPKQVKAAFVFNRMVRETKIDVPEIQSGVKVKLLPLMMPNPSGNDTIAFENRLPKELDLHRFVDHECIFEAQFMKPAMRILNALEWSPKKVISVEDFL